MGFQWFFVYSNGMVEFEQVASQVRDRVEPSRDERELLERVVDDLIDETQAAVGELPVDAEVRLVGSTARDTWISGDRDVDIFVRFPPELSRDELETYGLEVGHKVLPDGREEYAEHPYVTGSVDGFAIDLVPCYDVESTASAQSAVDRSPFHTAYLEDRLTDELIGEIRVFKQFLKGIGVYGSDLRTRGFSGYLTELLVCEYDSAKATLAAIADWKPPVTFDPADHGTVSFDDPLVVIDPTDPTRNVAAVVAADNIARLQHHARLVLAAPSHQRFFPEEPEELSAADVRAYLRDRGTTPVAIVVQTPDLVDDELYPQLDKSLSGIKRAFDHHGFEVFRAAAFARTNAVFLFELAVATRPPIERHEGPPVHVRAHAEQFFEKYANTDAFGPFIADNRYVVERDRAVTSAIEFLNSDALFETRLGPAIEAALAEQYSVLVEDDIATLATEFGTELADYFDPRP